MVVEVDLCWPSLAWFLFFKKKLLLLFFFFFLLFFSLPAVLFCVEFVGEISIYSIYLSYLILSSLPLISLSLYIGKLPPALDI